MFANFAASVIVTAVGQRPVQQIAARIAAEPLRAGLVGLLAEILFVPVLVVTVLALVISIIGIPLLLLVPFGIVLLLTMRVARNGLLTPLWLSFVRLGEPRVDRLSAVRDLPQKDSAA